jgi:hypothetical protein
MKLKIDQTSDVSKIERKFLLGGSSNQAEVLTMYVMNSESTSFFLKRFENTSTSVWPHTTHRQEHIATTRTKDFVQYVLVVLTQIATYDAFGFLGMINGRGNHSVQQE